MQRIKKNSKNQKGIQRTNKKETCSHGELNPRPLACKASALPTEL